MTLEGQRKRNLTNLKNLIQLKKKVEKGGHFPKTFPYVLQKTREGKKNELNYKISSTKEWFNYQARYRRKLKQSDEKYLIEKLIKGGQKNNGI